MGGIGRACALLCLGTFVACSQGSEGSASVAAPAPPAAAQSHAAAVDPGVEEERGQKTVLPAGDPASPPVAAERLAEPVDVPVLREPTGKVVAKVPVGKRGVFYRTQLGDTEAGPMGCSVDELGNVWIVDVHGLTVSPGLRQVKATGEVGGRVEFNEYVSAAVAIEGGFVALDARGRALLRYDSDGKRMAKLPIPGLSATHLIRSGAGVAVVSGRSTTSVDLSESGLALGGPLHGPGCAPDSVSVGGVRTRLRSRGGAGEVAGLLAIPTSGGALYEYVHENSDESVGVFVSAEGAVQGFAAAALDPFPVAYPFCTGPGPDVYALRTRKKVVEVVKVEFQQP